MTSRRCFIACSAVLLASAGCPSVPGEQPAVAPARPPPPLPEQPPPDEARSTAKFIFHSQIRTNLYHLLLNWAWFDLGEAPFWSPVILEREAGFAELSPGDRARWQKAVDAVAQRISKRSVLFDEGLIAVRAHMAGALALDAVPAEDRAIAVAVERALDLYERTWWPAHRRWNRAWVEALVPTLQQTEVMMTTRLAATYGGTWPADKLPIDVSAYVAPLGAYSTGGRVTITSRADGYRMPFALEMVMHEASHLGSLEPALREAIDQAFAAEGRKPPEGLWHDLIFYTSGEIARIAFAEIRGAGAPAYRHYGEMTGVYGRGNARWGSMLPILDKTWAPFVASSSSDAGKRMAALRAFAKALPEYPSDP